MECYTKIKREKSVLGREKKKKKKKSLSKPHK